MVEGKKANLLARIGLGAIITVTPFLNGCEESQINQNALLGALGTGAVEGARTPEQAKWGTMAQTYGTIAGSQSQVNVNVGYNAARVVDIKEFKACNILTDIHGNRLFFPEPTAGDYVNTHREDFIRGYKIEYYEYGKLITTETAGEFNQ